MFVGEMGCDRVVQRTAELMRAGKDPRAEGAVDVATFQRYLNLWYTLSLDLFGGEISSNAADFFAAGVKGRYKEAQHEDHVALTGDYVVPVVRNGALVEEKVAVRNAMNEILRDHYVEDCQRGVDRWNRTLERAGLSERLRLPSRRFHRQQGIHAGLCFDTEGNLLTGDQWEARKHEWLPSPADRAHVTSLMQGVHQPGRIASWIAPPAKGINGQAFEFEYVRRS